uniref:DDE-1 domain-containing protein n=1 Tax=Hyaloperonospora arabidopsidis (strain Emoy2) TaxID=559515 RepID=M4BV55_HYAAE
MANLLIEQRINSSWVFYMDETTFTPNSTTRTLLSIKGSRNVWRSSPTSACPSWRPLLSLVLLYLLSSSSLAFVCSIQSLYGARITVAPKGFSNATIFKDWLGNQNPVILTLDNSSRHVNMGNIWKPFYQYIFVS